MKLSLNWIRDYIDLPETLEITQLTHDLTMRTVEVEGAENPAEMLEGIVVGEVLSVEPHPNADKLRIAMTDVGALSAEPLQIVCGGSNLEPGQLVAVSVPGAMVRWHGEGEPVEIKPAELRGPNWIRTMDDCRRPTCHRLHVPRMARAHKSHLPPRNQRSARRQAANRR